MKTKPYKNLVGTNIRHVRQERNLTQEELALMSGLSQGYINQLESGKRKFTQKTLCVIAEALDLPLYEFFKEDTEEKKLRKKAEPYTKKISSREIFKILKALPPHIADHYMTLMFIEKGLYQKKSNRE